MSPSARSSSRCDYAQQRDTFGKPIAEHQAIAFQLAEMATKVEAAHLMMVNAARLKDSGERNDVEAGMAKYLASEFCKEVTQHTFRIHGGYGYSKEYEIERLMRDAPVPADRRGHQRDPAHGHRAPAAGGLQAARLSARALCAQGHDSYPRSMPTPKSDPFKQLANRPVLASYTTYNEAQFAVDKLSDHKFPVQHVAIVGVDLRLVESVLGRMSWGRAALGGMATFAWFGVLIGLFVSFFGSQDSSPTQMILLGLLFGAAFGIVFGMVSYAFTGGKRDFVSRRRCSAVAMTWCATPRSSARPGPFWGSRQ